MTRKEALQDLLVKVKAGEVDNDGIMYTLFDDKWLLCFDAYNGSMDAALSLFDAVLPGWVVNGLDQASNLAGNPWGCEVAYFCGSNPNNNHKAYSGHDYPTPSRALLIAILDALVEMEDK